MKLTKLQLKGFLSYKAAEIDLRSVDLACISGHNGAGKSSILDAITWGLFGQARRKDDAIINTEMDAACVTLEFEYEGNQYQVQRSKKKDRPTSVEFRIKDNGKWKPLTEPTIRETEAKIQAILRMDYETFVNSTFFLQGKADSFAQQKPADRKRILINILGLDRWENFKEIAASHRRKLENEQAIVMARVQEILAELEEEPIRVRRFENAKSTAEALGRARETQEQSVEQLRVLWSTIEQMRQQAQALALEMESLQGRRSSVIASLDERTAEIAVLEGAMAQKDAIVTAYQKWQQVKSRLAEMEASSGDFNKLQAEKSVLTAQISSAENRLRQEISDLERRDEAIQKARDANIDLARQRDDLQRTLDQLIQEVETISSLETRQEEIREACANAKAENPRLKEGMQKLKGRIDSLKAIHNGTCPCPYCNQPLSPEAREKLVEELTAQGKTLGDAYRQNEKLVESTAKELADLQIELTRLREKDSQARALSQRISILTAKIEASLVPIDEWEQDGALKLVEKRDQLARNEYLTAEQNRIAEIDAELRHLGYNVDEHERLRQEEAANREAETGMRNLEKAEAALIPLKREADGMNQSLKDTDEGLQAKRAACDQLIAQMAQASENAPNLEQAVAQLETARAKETQAMLELGAARQRVEVLGNLRERVGELKAQKAKLAQDIANYQSLEKAFGKDGVPALLIEQALPAIEVKANEILSLLSNGNMSVSFSTQKEYKDKKREDLKETLDILIDVDGYSREYESLSGGEAFRVNFAIRLALSEILAQRAGARLQMLVIDEGFGSQDDEGRQRLIEAINAVSSQFEKILVVTHIESLKDAFPNRIEVSKGENGSVVSVV